MPRELVIMMSVLVALLAPAAAAAQGTMTSSPPSPYEAAKLTRALEATGATLERAPEGKTVEAIDIVPLEVVEDDDPAPGFLNVFHATTRVAVLRREVLLRVGEPYRQYRVDETVRALRVFPQLSLVLAVATRGSTPGAVRVLVVTKDVWSLRAQWELKLGAGGLDVLRFEPTERNLFGRMNAALARFELYPNTITLGAGYLAPRLANERIYFVSDANVVFNREGGHAEGSFGRVAASSPQISADMAWLWGVATTWQNVYMRRYVGAKLATFDAVATPEQDPVPDVFHQRAMTTTAGVVRSYGVARKLDVELGGELNVRQFTGLDPSANDPRVVAEYREKRVPTSDRRAGPWAQVRAYESRFLRLHDFDLLGLQEDYRVGYDAWLRAYPVARAIGSTRDFLGLHGLGQYILPMATGFLRVTLEAMTELQADAVPTAAAAANVAIIGPSFGIGRVVLDGVALARPRNYLNQRSALGGEGRLRGYPSAAFLGENLVAYNVELRSAPVEILKCQLGAALFFDVGDAFDGSAFSPKSSAGFGVRSLIPHLDRRVFRFDVAFPLVRAGDAGPVGFYIAFEQAFPETAVTAPAVAPAQSILSPLGGALGQ